MALNFSYYDTMNNESDYTYDYDYDYSLGSVTNTPYIVMYSVLLYLGLCTNIWMLWSLYKTWEAGGRAYFYLLVICIAETLGLCIYCSLRISQNITYSWFAGDVGCKIFMGFWLFGSTLVHYILVGFNLDSICTLLKGRASKAMRVVFLVLAILCSVAANLQNFVFYGTRAVGYQMVVTICTPEHSYIFGLSIYDINMITTTVVPLLVTLVFAGPLICVWCAKKGTITYEKFSSDDASSDMKTMGRDVGLVICFDILFLICWAPRVFLNVMSMFDLTTAMVSDGVSLCHAILNPVVYGVVKICTRRRVSPGL